MQIQKTQVYHFNEIAERARIEKVFDVAGTKKLCKELLAVLDLFVSGDFQAVYEKTKTWDRAKLEHLHPVMWDVLMATAKAQELDEHPNLPKYEVLNASTPGADTAAVQQSSLASGFAKTDEFFTAGEKEQVRDCIREALVGMKFGHHITNSKIVIFQESSSQSLLETFKLEIEDKMLQNEALSEKITAFGIEKEAFFECLDAGVDEAMGKLDHVEKRDVLSVIRSSKKFSNAMSELLDQLSDHIVKSIGQATQAAQATA